VRKLTFLILTACVFVILISMVSCKKTTTNNTVVKDSIYYSPWTQLSMQFDATDSVYYQDFTNSQITASVVSSGAVLAYFGYPGQTAGDTIVVDEATMALYYATQLSFGTGTMELETPYPYDLSYSNNGYLFRYVIIPANVLSSTAYKNLSRDQLNHLSFTDVSKALNVPVEGNKAGTQPRLQ
jgi:hypothetical protein